MRDERTAEACGARAGRSAVHDHHRGRAGRPVHRLLRPDERLPLPGAGDARPARRLLHRLGARRVHPGRLRQLDAGQRTGQRDAPDLAGAGRPPGQGGPPLRRLQRGARDGRPGRLLLLRPGPAPGAPDRDLPRRRPADPGVLQPPARLPQGAGRLPLPRTGRSDEPPGAVADARLLPSVRQRGPQDHLGPDVRLRGTVPGPAAAAGVRVRPLRAASGVPGAAHAVPARLARQPLGGRAGGGVAGPGTVHRGPLPAARRPDDVQRQGRGGARRGRPGRRSAAERRQGTARRHRGLGM